VSVRSARKAFGGSQLSGFRAGNSSVLGYMRGGPAARVLVLANFSELDPHCPAPVFSALPASALDLLTGCTLPLRAGLTLAPYEVLWLECDGTAS
jgi:amylosucrase